MFINDIKEIVNKNIHVGDVIKNYKVMCKLLNEPIVTSNSKKAQITNWKRYFNFTKDKTKFIITEVYDEPLNNSGYMYYDNSLKEQCFKISDDNKNKKGVYIIQKENDVYIGSTVSSFWLRFIQHLGGYDNQAPYRYTKPLILNGGTFKDLWIASDDDTIKQIREIEESYIFKYVNSGEYNVINIRFSDPLKTKKIKHPRVYISDFYIARRLTHKKFHICDIINLQNEITYVFTYTPRLSNYLNDNNIKFLASSK